MPMADDIAASFMGSKPAGPVEETDKAKQAAEKLIVPTVETAILCGSDKVCLEQEARRTALVVADELVACASTSQDGGGHDRN